MKKFDVCIRGQNFLIKKGSKVKKNGFYAARFIEANDYSDAVGIVMDSFRTELKDVVINDKSDPPKMNVVEVNEVYYFQDKMFVGDKVLPGEGFIWDEEWDEEELSKPISSLKERLIILRDISNRIGVIDIHTHSICIHFTNGLYPVAILFMFLFLLSGKVSFHQTYYYIMLIATFSVPFSYLTGILEWKKRYRGAMIPIFYAKIRYGMVIFVLGGLCTLWYFIYPGVLENVGIQRLAFILLNVSILVPLMYMGHLGSIIVYEKVV